VKQQDTAKTSSKKSSKKSSKNNVPKEKSDKEPAPKSEQAKAFSKKALPAVYQGRKWSINDPIPYKPISCEDVSFKHVSNVTESWEKVRRIPNFENVAGELLLRKMFELHKDFRLQFGFPENVDFNDPKVYKDKKFIMHGASLVVAVDKAIDYLGPDLEPLEMELEELGSRHVHMGAKPEHWPLVGDALFHVLEVGLGKEVFNDKLKKSYKVVYHFLAYYMIRGLLQELSSRS